VTGQLAAEQRERSTEAKAETITEFAQIKRELDARRLLIHLSKTHGVIPEKYEITQGKDGGDRIKAGSRNLNVSDFLTQEMRLSFTEAAPILRGVYAAQGSREVTEARPAPQRELWEDFRKAKPDQVKQKAKEWEAQRQGERERRAVIRNAYQAKRQAIKSDKRKSPTERKAALSIASMKRVTEDMALRETVSIERQQIKEKYGQSHQVRYRAFLADLANRGDEAALLELRRQRDTVGMADGLNTIEGSSKAERDEQAATIARRLAYSIDHSGNVTYYADATKRRALVIDSGQRVTVTAVKDSQAVEAGLLLAVQKFGPSLKIDGSKEFKRQVIEAALKTGLHVEFDSQAMKDELNRLRAERDDLQARGKAFIATIATEAEKALPVTPVPAKAPVQEQTNDNQPEPPQQPRKPRGIDR